MNVKTALRVVDIVETFASHRRPLPLSELARVLSIPLSSCHALVRTLEHRGYLYETAPRQGYYPTGRLLTMSQQISRHDPVLARARSTLAELRDATRETIVFGTLSEDDRVIYLDVLESPNSIRYTAQAGEFRAPYANSLGKALLSMQSAEQRAKLLSGMKLKRITRRTLTTAKAIEADLAASRKRGWFANLAETMPDIAAIAWPVRLGHGVYAISIAGPMYRLEPGIASYARMLRSACASLEQK